MNLHGYFDGKTHVLPFKVYYEDTDALGVVFYANYLKFAERGRTAYFNLLGYQLRDFQTENIGFVVRKATIDYHQPLVLEDVCELHTKITEIGKTRICFLQEIFVKGKRMNAMEIVLVCINLEPRVKATALPPPILNLLKEKS